MIKLEKFISEIQKYSELCISDLTLSDPDFNSYRANLRNLKSSIRSANRYCKRKYPRSRNHEIKKIKFHLNEIDLFFDNQDFVSILKARNFKPLFFLFEIIHGHTGEVASSYFRLAGI